MRAGAAIADGATNADAVAVALEDADALAELAELTARGLDAQALASAAPVIIATAPMASVRHGRERREERVTRMLRRSGG
jgi:hypothetical protein